MLTGCLADVHGVYSNGEFKYLLDGLTVMEIIKTTHPTTKIAFITGKEEHVGVLLFKYAVDEIDFYQTETIGAIQVTEKVRELIRKWNGEDFFIVAHYRTPDVVGHIAGVNSQRYKDAIKLNDDQLGRLLEVLPVGTKVYVLSDHGFGHPQPTTHGDAPDTFIVSTEQIGNGLYMKAVAKFFLNHFNLTPFCE
jgi:predicted AlkP superfamily pyrophosphatase or phosphodiesterase